MVGKSPKNIFISYSHDDGSRLADNLEVSLRQRNHAVFLDSKSLQAGANWMKAIEKHILDATHFLFILTPGSIKSNWCEDEFQIAKRNNKKIIPILSLPCEFPGFMGNIQYCDFQNEDNYFSSVQELVRIIEDEPLPPPPSKQKWRQLPITDFAVHSRNQKVHCIPKTMPLYRAHGIIANDIPPGRFRHLLVTEDGNIGSRLHGVLSLRQILKLENHPEAKKNHDFLRNITVDQVMDVYDPTPTEDPTFVWLHEEDTVQSALVAFTTKLTKAAAMNQFFYMSAVPLVDSANNAVGIISFKDILLGMTVKQLIPIPPGTVGQYMNPLSKISIGTPDDTVEFAKIGLRMTGQRDIPIVNSMDESELLGLIPDHVFVRYYFYPEIELGQTEYTPTGKLKLQTRETRLSDMLEQYVSKDVAKRYQSFAVVTALGKSSYRLEGLIGYREIFEALLKE